MIIEKIIKLLSYQEQKQAIKILIITLIMAFLDMIGVASILPFLAILTNQEIIETNVILYKLFIFFEFETKNDFVFFMGCSAFILLVFALAFKSFTVYMQLQFALMHEYRLSKLLVERYLGQPYKWFLNRNSAKISKSILSEVSAITNGCVMPIISLITQSAVAIAIIALLFFVDPIVSLIVSLVFGIAYSLIYKTVSSLLNKLGIVRTETNDKRFTVVSEAFGAFKEVKVNGLESFFISRCFLKTPLTAL